MPGDSRRFKEERTMEKGGSDRRRSEEMVGARLKLPLTFKQLHATWRVSKE